MTQVQDVRRAKVETEEILTLALGCAAVSVGCVAIPMFVIRPFRPQGAQELDFALTVRHVGPWLAGVSAAVVLLFMVRFWKNARVGLRISLAGLFVLATAGAVLAHVNIFEKMFHPYDSPVFAGADDVKVDPDDKVLAVRVGQEARAYPIRTMGYHHIVNDMLVGRAIAVGVLTACWVRAELVAAPDRGRKAGPGR
jgi:hypothetical protein